MYNGVGSIHSGCTLSLPALPNLTGASGLCHWVHFPNQTSLKLWTVHMSLSEASYRQGFNQLQSSFGVIQIFTGLCPVHPSAPHSPPLHSSVMQENISTKAPSPITIHQDMELPVLLLGQGELCVNMLATAPRAWKCFSFLCWC